MSYAPGDKIWTAEGPGTVKEVNGIILGVQMHDPESAILYSFDEGVVSPRKENRA